MIRTSRRERNARGRAAETAARPPTRTKSSISVVTNKTLKKRPLNRCSRNYARMVPVSFWVNAGRALTTVRCSGGVIAFPAQPRQLGSCRGRGYARPKGVFGMTIAANDEGNLTKSFAGLRVLDFSTTIAGPHCTRMLADMGAEVIKVESVEGETMRTRPPVRNGFSSAFGQLNVGKKSLVLDLKSSDAVEIIRRLVASADILVENFRPGVMRRLHLDYGSLRELNPKLIYCSISGYGQTGPSAELPAYAPVIHAASGYDMAHLAYQQGRERPDYCGIYHADILTGVYAYGAIASALLQRQHTGQGQHIDVSMLESMLSLTQTEVQGAQFPIKPPQRPMF